MQVYIYTAIVVGGLAIYRVATIPFYINMLVPSEVCNNISLSLTDSIVTMHIRTCM